MVEISRGAPARALMLQAGPKSSRQNQTGVRYMDNQFLTRIKRVNRLRAAVLDDRLSAREILEEAERVLAETLNKMQGWRRGR